MNYSSRNSTEVHMSDIAGFDKLAAAEEILVALREHLQELELQQARQGFHTPPGVATEIRHYTERIRAKESEVARLRTEGAVDRFPLSEARYRASLAAAWGDRPGRPSVLLTTSLEHERLQLGVLPERAQELEDQVRAELAEECLKTV